MLLHGRRVRRDGLYARPRYRCLPSDGPAPHTLTLPRRATTHLHPDGLRCPACEQETARSDGAVAAPKTTFVITDVARLIAQVGEGSSLREASRRLRAEVGARNSSRRISRQNALAADYLDRLGPLVVGAVRPARWPRYLVLDSLPLNLRIRDDEAALLGLGVGLDGGAIMVAAGKDDPLDVAGAWFAAFAGDETAASWFEFLTSIPTDPAPVWVVADRAKAIAPAVAAVWPGTQFYPCEFHLGENIRMAAADDGLLVVRSIEEAIETCLWSHEQWDRLRAVVEPYPSGSLTTWITANDALARGLFAIKRCFPGAPLLSGQSPSGQSPS